MRTAALPNFSKLYGKIEGPLVKGEYKVIITDNYDVSKWSGKKNFTLIYSEHESMGG